MHYRAVAWPPPWEPVPGEQEQMMRWAVGILGALVVLAAGFAGWVWFGSEAHLKSFDRPPAFTREIPSDEASVARGDHLVRTRGCRGCHGEQLEGKLIWDMAAAPNLAEYVRTHSPATFEAALRHAIGHDGRALFSMPSFNFLRLRDEDVADILAYLRTVPVVENELPRGRLPWKIRYDLARGADWAVPGYIDRVPQLSQQGNPNPRIARGEYIAMTTCNECHGLSLRADVPWEGETAPDLLIVMAYDEASFTHLMRTGKALGERELPLMSGVARGRFAYFTDEEVADLYAFLRDMAMRAASAAGTS